MKSGYSWSKRDGVPIQPYEVPTERTCRCGATFKTTHRLRKLCDKCSEYIRYQGRG